MRNVVYVAYDSEENVIAWADSRKELAEILGVTVASVNRMIYLQKGKMKRYVCMVRITDDEED